MLTHRRIMSATNTTINMQVTSVSVIAALRNLHRRRRFFLSVDFNVNFNVNADQRDDSL